MCPGSTPALEGLFARDPVTVARDLVGTFLEVNGCGGTIVETEAYRHDDPASHSFRGQTNRNRSMFGPWGTVYVYRAYGVHWCLNFVCGSHPKGGAVLIRAIEPTMGLDRMKVRRRTKSVLQLCSGPGKLTEALGIDGTFDGLPLKRSPLKLILPRETGPAVATGCRIGIIQAREVPWRFGVSDSPFLSRHFD